MKFEHFNCFSFVEVLILLLEFYVVELGRNLFALKQYDYEIDYVFIGQFGHRYTIYFKDQKDLLEPWMTTLDIDHLQGCL